MRYILFFSFFFMACAHQGRNSFPAKDRKEISSVAADFLTRAKIDNNILGQTQIAENFFELKKYYFNTLNNQLIVMNSWLSKKSNNLKSCPMFHDQFLATQVSQSRPEIILSTSERRGAEERVENLSAELKEFCDTGATQDFYKFHNLMLTIYQSNYQAEDYISGIEKMQVFQNHYFISKKDHQFSDRDLASGNEVDQLFKAPFVWFTKVTR